MGAVASPVRLLAGAAQPQDLGVRWTGTRPTRRGSSSSCWTPPRSRRCSTRACPRTPGTRSRRSRCPASAGWCRSGSADGEDAALKVCDRAQLFTLAESLGGVESLIEHPGRMTHASAAGSALEVPADLVRVSVGIEDVDDLLDDLEQALASPPGRGRKGPRPDPSRRGSTRDGRVWTAIVHNVGQTRPHLAIGTPTGTLPTGQAPSAARRVVGARGGEDARAVVGDGDRVLDVGGPAAVGAAERPAVGVHPVVVVPPARNQGSMAMTSPARSGTPRPARPSFGTCGASCMVCRRRARPGRC